MPACPAAQVRGQVGVVEVGQLGVRVAPLGSRRHDDLHPEPREQATTPPTYDPDDVDSSPEPPLGKATEWVEVELDLDSAKKMLRLIDALEDSDDVQNVYSNANIPADVMAQLEDDE